MSRDRPARSAGDHSFASARLTEHLLRGVIGFGAVVLGWWLRGESGIGTWLYTTVRNACLQILRRAARQHRVLGHQMGDDVLADVADPDLGPEQEVVRRDLAALVRDALGSLDPRHLEVLLLRDVECLSGSDTAARLGIGLPAMKSRLKRARTALRDEVFERL
jgi:RNA polymerase sigma-70 factor (ECF subfamily)